MRIVRLANFVAPHSGGLRTTLAELGAGYLAAGHEPVLVMPGERDSDTQTAQGRVITLRAPRVPFTGGYRVLWRRRRLARLLADLRPDALEVSDRTTLRWTGAWAREHGVPAVMVSHESVTALLKLTRLGLDRAVADWLNRRTARAYHRINCTTGWAAAEFGRIDAGNVVRVPLGVDLDTFSPPGEWGRIRTRYVGEGQILLVHCGRLSADKKPQRSLTTLATLRSRGHAGLGWWWRAMARLRARCLVRRAARGHVLPVTFAGFLARPGRPGRAAGQRRRGHRAPGPKRETFSGCSRAGGAGLRDPGGGRARGPRCPRSWARPGRACRASGTSRPACAAVLARPAAGPAGRRPRPRGAVRLGHGHPRLPRRSRSVDGTAIRRSA